LGSAGGSPQVGRGIRIAFGSVGRSPDPGLEQAKWLDTLAEEKEHARARHAQVRSGF
jgi:hypothetical protein